MKSFKTVSQGYDKKEVQSFIKEITAEYESMLSKLKQKDHDIELLKHQLKEYKEMETTLNKAVSLAEESSVQIKKIAQEEAAQIINEAKKNASHIINDALLKAEKVSLKTDELERSLKTYKARVKEAVKEQLIILDEVDRISDDYKDQ